MRLSSWLTDPPPVSPTHVPGPDEAALENVYVTFSLFVLALPLDVFPEALRPIVDECG